jgi:arylsulfatase A-like enzyme
MGGQGWCPAVEKSGGEVMTRTKLSFPMPGRRPVIRFSLLFGSVFFLFVVLSWARVQSDSPPNIVVFIADDLAVQDTSPYGSDVARTPNLDRLASESLLFTRAFAASPTCSPSRSALYTGRMPFNNGAHANHTGVKDGTQSIVQYLRPLGYRVAIAGKLHVGPETAFPFERIEGTNTPEPGHVDDGVLWTDLDLEPVDRWFSALPDDRRFALIVADHSPHVIWPETPTYESNDVNVYPRHIDTPEYRKFRTRYFTDVTKMDRNVGLLMEQLDRHGLADNTIFVFVADQGPQWPFGKWGLYDYGIQTPLIVRWPGKLKETGRKTDAMVSLVDLLPTIIEAAGGTTPGGLDGESFLPVLLGERDRGRNEVFATHTGDGEMNRAPMRMLRTERYKYILNLAPEITYTTHMDKAKGPISGAGYWDSWRERSFRDSFAASVLWRYHNRPAEELYDIQEDPNETINLAGDPSFQNLIEEFRGRMSRWRKQQGDFKTGPEEPLTAEERKARSGIAPYIF